MSGKLKQHLVGLFDDTTRLLRAFLNADGIEQRFPFPYVLAQSAVAVSIVEPAATFTTLTAADSGATPGKLQLSSAGVHGLTAGASLAGVNVYVAWSGGTGVSGLYPLLSVDSTTALTLNTSSTGFAGMGTAVMTVLNNKLTLASITVPGDALGPNGALRALSLWSCTNSAGVKTAGVEYSTLVVPAALANLASFVGENLIRNRNNTNSQVSQATLSGGSTAVLTATINSDAAQTLAITAKPAAANEVMTLEGYTIEVLPLN